ncbi:MAG: serine/threonine protein phosphatase [Chlorobi bacterium]|nr:serine/threonine protein phosphatase [Chlorobiota bacterium]
MTKKWVIPDIHGCALTLKYLIESQIKPNKNDEIYFVGDYIDRGPDSKGVMDYIMAMEENDYNITCLMGNHEDYCIRAWEEDTNRKGFLGIRPKGRIQKEWEKFGGVQTLESFETDRPRDIPEKYINWMKKLKYYVELDDYIIVHAGLNFGNDDPFEDKRAMIWARDYKIIPEKIGNKKIIHGHVPVNHEFINLAINSNDYKFIDIDNGVYIQQRPGYGNLFALELNEMKYTTQSLMDEVDYKGV